MVRLCRDSISFSRSISAKGEARKHRTGVAGDDRNEGFDEENQAKDPEDRREEQGNHCGEAFDDDYGESGMEKQLLLLASESSIP